MPSLCCHSVMPSLRCRSVMPSVRCRSVMPPLRCRSVMPSLRCHSVMPSLRCHSVMPSLRCRSVTPSLWCHSVMPSLRCRSVTPSLWCHSFMTYHVMSQSHIPRQYGIMSLCPMASQYDSSGNNMSTLPFTASCSLASDTGSCTNYTVNWYYDVNRGACARFWYGGCEGNTNRFNSKEHCESVCVRPPGTGKSSPPTYICYFRPQLLNVGIVNKQVRCKISEQWNE